MRDALPVVGVCVTITLGRDGNCTQARVALSGLAGGCQRAPAGEDLLRGCNGDAAAIERGARARHVPE